MLKEAGHHPEPSHRPAFQDPSGRPEAPKYAEYFLLLALVGIFIWRGFLPAWRSLNTDFPNYYLTARLYRQGYPLERVYDWIWFQRQKDHAEIEQPLVGYLPDTLFSCLAVLPLASLPPLEAKRCWLIINLILLGLIGFLLGRMTALGARRVAILVFLAVIPLRTNFLYGQYHLLVLFLLTLAAWLYRNGWYGTSGGAVAVSAGLKLYPVLFLFYFARKKAWRAVTGLLAGCLAVEVLSLRLFGFNALRTYWIEVLPRALRGEDIDPYNVNWNSFTALLRRLFTAEPELNPHPLAHVPAAYAVVQSLLLALLFVSFLWRVRSSRAEAEREKLEWGGYIALLLMLSTHPASYHFCVLILTGVLATDYLLQAGQPGMALALVLFYALACFPLSRFTPASPAGWRTFLAFPRLYALTALWVVAVWALGEAGSQASFSRVKPSERLVFGALFLVLLVGGCWSNLRHLKGQFANYLSRLIDVPESLLEIDPAAADKTIAFTTLSLTQNRYVTANKDGASLSLLSSEADTFHPALARGFAGEWVELASSRSRVVRYSAINSVLFRDRPTVEAEDAEQPVISADGKRLAFIREIRGRGSLWVKDLRVSQANTQLEASEWQIVNATYDVRDVGFFPDGRVVFAAEPEGVPKLFVADAISGQVSPFPTHHQRTRYPAVSPDGEWLAYSEQERGAWQLCVLRLHTGEERCLTGGDCNSVTSAWLPDSRTLIYATDCGRGLGLTALCRIGAVP